MSNQYISHHATFFEKPQGVRDYLPGIAAKKRAIEQQIMQHYGEWGYEEVITPTLEYIDLFQNGSMKNINERVFKFFERSGRTIVLRPDMTAPIARVVSSLLKDEPLPMRLSYQGSLFRIQEVVAGRDAEFTQAGVELVGDESVDADAEVIALAVQTLRRIGIEGFRIAIGNVQFLQAVLAEYVEDLDVRESLQKALEDKNYVEYEEIVRTQSFSTETRQILNEITTLRGDRSMLQRARELTSNALALRALDTMEELWDHLALYQVHEFVTFDLSVVLAMHYYTGIVFEGYAPRIGFPICGGGRYDDLYVKFGTSVPATGFMIGVDRLLDLLLETATQDREPFLLLFDPEIPSDRQAAVAFANYVRSRGYRIAVQNRRAFSLTNPSDRVLTFKHARMIETKLIRFEAGTIHTDDHKLESLYHEFQQSMS
jgi:ATP phosphoribosyltransferase regulatory subunit